MTVKARPRDLALIFVSFICMVLLGVYLLNIENNSTSSSILHLIFLLPVVSVAYFFGVLPGIMTAFVFSSLLLFEIPIIINYNGFTIASIERVGSSLFLFIAALVVGDLSTSVRQRTSLRLALKNRETLLSQTLNLEEISRIVISQVHQILRVQQVCLILQNPITKQWQAYSNKGRNVLRTTTSDTIPTLGGFLLSQNESIILNNLDTPESILAENLPPPDRVVSVCSRILYHSNGTEMGRIIMINKINGFFYNEDIDRLNEFIPAVEKAIEQAYRYVRTDYALERQISQLSTIQRTSQVLNTLLDAEKVVELTLATALDITQADSGIIWINYGDNINLKRISGDQIHIDRTNQILEEAIFASRLEVEATPTISLPFIFNKSASQLSSLIRHSSTLMGVILIESSRVEAFDRTTQWILSLLTDHAATSLANVRLFREIYKEKLQTSLIIESITDGLLTIDQEGTIHSANPACQMQIGLSEKDIIGQNVSEILGFEEDMSAQFFKAIQTAWRKQESIKMDAVKIHPVNAKTKVVNFSAAPIFRSDHTPSRMVLLLRDISEREELNRLQEEMISSISHEMRTPLTKIQSIAEMISTQLDRNGELPEKRFLDTLSSESQRLSHFLDRILDVHQIETQQFNVELRPLPLSYVIKNLIEEWRIITPNRRIDFQTPEHPVWVVADENALNSIISNLIENAIKYSADNSDILVRLEILADKHAIVSVIDNGIGIESDKIPFIFDRFYRVAGSDSQEIYGHGIGLYVAKILTEALGGKIGVVSEPGKGSRFYFDIPVLKEVIDETKNRHD
ncbi:MAG: ATP-binding protein [Chloroflexota bacterium]